MVFDPAVFDAGVFDAPTGAFQADAFQNDSFQVEVAPGGLGSFSAQAVLKGSASSSFTANAMLRVGRSGSFTADSRIADHFDANAVLKKFAIAGSITANAIPLLGRSGSITADAVLLSGLRANAVIQKTGIAGSFSADAGIERGFKADAVLHSDSHGRVTQAPVEVLHTPTAAPVRITQAPVEVLHEPSSVPIRITQAPIEVLRLSFDTRTFTFSANAELVSGSVSGSLTADAITKRNQPFTFAADARLGGIFYSNAVLHRPAFGSIAAGAWIAGRFTADAVIHSDAAIRVTQDGLQAMVLPTDSAVRVTQTGIYVLQSPYPGGVAIRVTQGGVEVMISTTPSFPSNAVIKKTSTGLLTADARIGRLGENTFTANAILKFQWGTNNLLFGWFTADSWIRSPNQQIGSFSSDAVLTGGNILIKHDRTTHHSGTDRDANHYLFSSVGRFAYRTPITDVLIDLDARITAMEAGGELRYRTFTADAVLA